MKRRLLAYSLICAVVGPFLYLVAAYQIDITPKPRDRVASARCKDQTLSYSQHRSGTCSRHQGVEMWLVSP